mmetsp:Transcript_53387/g.169739  ORF Transcript_53387/g.169739 Transcript_53387/m.169739 type:complete len:249 (-) Transcript_53387:33-779(-)
MASSVRGVPDAVLALKKNRLFPSGGAASSRGLFSPFRESSLDPLGLDTWTTMGFGADPIVCLSCSPSMAFWAPSGVAIVTNAIFPPFPSFFRMSTTFNSATSPYSLITALSESSVTSIGIEVMKSFLMSTSAGLACAFVAAGVVALAIGTGSSAGAGAGLSSGTSISCGEGSGSATASGCSSPGTAGAASSFAIASSRRSRSAAFNPEVSKPLSLSSALRSATFSFLRSATVVIIVCGTPGLPPAQEL